MSEVRAALRDKYARLVALREAKLAGLDPPPDALRSLAEAFPGALRELDRAPLPELRERLEALGTQAPLPPWAGPSFDVHRLLQIAQAARRAAGRGRDRAAALSALREAGEGGALVDAVLQPPGGRLSWWAYEEVGRRRLLSPSQVERLVHGHLRAG